jgi:hypothetical protein
MRHEKVLGRQQNVRATGNWNLFNRARPPSFRRVFSCRPEHNPSAVNPPEILGSAENSWAKPALVQVELRSEVNGMAISWSRWSRLNQRSWSPRIRCALGFACLTLRTCSVAGTKRSDPAQVRQTRSPRGRSGRPQESSWRPCAPNSFPGGKNPHCSDDAVDVIDREASRGRRSFTITQEQPSSTEKTQCLFFGFWAVDQR